MSDVPSRSGISRDWFLPQIDCFYSCQALGKVVDTLNKDVRNGFDASPMRICTGVRALTPVVCCFWSCGGVLPGP